MSTTAAERRTVAAARYRPDVVRCLLVAEAPPAAVDRYFYFEDVREQDSLFRHVAEGVLGSKPERAGKRQALEALRDQGYLLIDLCGEPVVSRADLPKHVPDLVRRAVESQPERVILIKANVFDLAFGPLTAAGLPVVPVRIPFPGSGQQARFKVAFAAALGHPLSCST